MLGQVDLNTLKFVVKGANYQSTLHTIQSVRFLFLCSRLLSHELVVDMWEGGGRGESASVLTHWVYTRCLQSQYNCVCVCSTDFPL
jgi:hypothetical protein